MAGTRAVHRDADDDQDDACQVTYGRDRAERRLLRAVAPGEGERLVGGLSRVPLGAVGAHGRQLDPAGKPFCLCWD